MSTNMNRRRIPLILTVTWIALTTAAALATLPIAGTEGLSLLLLGSGTALVAVIGGWYVAQLAFRGPDVFATKLVVGGFLVRLILLALTMTALVLVTGVEPARFVLWLVTFYFVLILVEAWLLARESLTMKEGSIR